MIAPSTLAYRCYSCSTQNTPGLNYQLKIHVETDKVECFCKNYELYSICAHALATAHLDNSFLNTSVGTERLKTRLPVAVFTQSVNVTRAGLKDNQIRRKRTKPMIEPGCPRKISCR